jgi:hypothetical protein
VHSDHESEIVPAHVEYNHLFSAFNLYGISAGISPPQIG